MNHTRGVSLVELMIALCIASFLSLGVWQIVMISQRAYQSVNQALSDAFELTLVGEFLADRIRHAGFMPCLAIDRLVTSDGGNGMLQPYAWEPHQTRLVLNRMSMHYVSAHLIDTQHIQVDENLGAVDQTKSYVIADCYHAEIVRVSRQAHVHAGDQLEFIQTLQFSYLSPLYIGEWLSEGFSVVPHKGLMYQARRHDVLSQAVQRMSVQCVRSAEHMLFQICLETLSGKKRQIWVSRRMA